MRGETNGWMLPRFGGTAEGFAVRFENRTFVCFSRETFVAVLDLLASAYWDVT